jgi:hypothetical protein
MRRRRALQITSSTGNRVLLFPLPSWWLLRAQCVKSVCGGISRCDRPSLRFRVACVQHCNKSTTSRHWPCAAALFIRVHTSGANKSRVFVLFRPNEPRVSLFDVSSLRACLSSSNTFTKLRLHHRPISNESTKSVPRKEARVRSRLPHGCAFSVPHPFGVVPQSTTILPPGAQEDPLVSVQPPQMRTWQKQGPAGAILMIRNVAIKRGRNPNRGRSGLSLGLCVFV